MSVALSRKNSDPGTLGVRTILGVALVLNLVGYAVYKKVYRTSGGLSPSALLHPTPEAETGRKSASDELARAQRAAGLAALEAGDYPAAVRSFTAALKLSQGEGDT